MAWSMIVIRCTPSDLDQRPLPKVLAEVEAGYRTAIDAEAATRYARANAEAVVRAKEERQGGSATGSFDWSIPYN